MKFDYDIIECLNNKFYKLSSRQFIKCPYKKEDFGKISPRCFTTFDVRKPGDGGFFASSVLNSFPDIKIQVQFLNRFYQCLLFNQLPHKTRKLVCVGEKDSGKSSWAKIFYGLFPKSKIASISKEKTFGSSMLEEDTQILWIDEWNEDTLSSDMAKILFQGGTFTQARKHQTPVMQNNRAGIFITCNKIPNFGDDQENVLRRLAVFHTTELETLYPEAPAWIEKHAMECVVWMGNVINRNSGLLDAEDLFYEKPFNVMVDTSVDSSIPSDEVSKLKELSFGSSFKLISQTSPLLESIQTAEMKSSKLLARFELLSPKNKFLK